MDPRAGHRGFPRKTDGGPNAPGRRDSVRGGQGRQCEQASFPRKTSRPAIGRDRVDCLAKTASTCNNTLVDGTVFRGKPRCPGSLSGVPRGGVGRMTAGALVWR